MAAGPLAYSLRLPLLFLRGHYVRLAPAIAAPAIDVADESAVRIYETSEALIAAPSRSRVKDPLGFLNRPGSVAVTRVFASQRGLEIGDELPLETATGRRRFVVRGLLEAEGVARAF